MTIKDLQEHIKTLRMQEYQLIKDEKEAREKVDSYKADILMEQMITQREIIDECEQALENELNALIGSKR